MPQFIPDLNVPISDTPFFEDNPTAKIPGRGTEKSVASLQQEITNLINRLGGNVIEFRPGKYPGDPQRYGFQIHFTFSSARGRIDCAALPMRQETSHKKDRALAQALYLVRDKLQAELYAQVYEPGGVPLVPYLIGAGGKTVTEALIEAGNLPVLGSGSR